MILSRLVDAFLSRILLAMPPVPKPHNTACVLSWEETCHWQSRASGYSSSWGSISKWVPLIPLQSSALCHSGHREVSSSFWPTYSYIVYYHGSVLLHCSCFVDVVIPDGLAIRLTGVLCSMVIVDHSSFQCGICGQGIIKSQLNSSAHSSVWISLRRFAWRFFILHWRGRCELEIITARSMRSLH